LDQIHDFRDNLTRFFARMSLTLPPFNVLENLLTNNLIRRKDELVQALQEISVEDRHQQLENSINDLRVSSV
jgi:structural maintenance of chromosome 3 (chondroitin sulfate proteoglycan 6)